MSEALDYYEILGASRSSTVEELKKAYKKMALVWHPDRHSNDSDKVRKEAEEQFKLVSEANDVLQDPHKKAIFDIYGCYPAHRLFRPGQQQMSSSAGTSRCAATFPRTAPAPKTPSSFYKQETHEHAANPRGSSYTPSPSSTPSSSSPPSSTSSSDPSRQQPDNRTSYGGFAERAARGDGGTGGDGGRSRDPTAEESVRREREREVKLAGVEEAMERVRRKERDGPAHTYTPSATRPMGKGGFTPNESPAAYTPPTTSERERERERERESVVQSSRKLAGASRKPEGIIRRLEISLEELFAGCKKRIEYERRIVDGVSQKTLPLIETLIVEVPIGSTDGHQMVYAGMGHEEVGCDTAGDLIVVVTELPHPLFRRSGNDLVYELEITLQQALAGFFLELPSLEVSRPIILELNEHDIILDGDVHIVPHRGMPYPQSNGRVLYGDMKVEICVLMPKGPLSPEKRVEIFEALEGLDWRRPIPRPQT